MLDEREFFVRKAIGWVLRDTSRKRPDLVFEWLLPRAARASGVTRREAVKYLSAEQRDAIAAGNSLVKLQFAGGRPFHPLVTLALKRPCIAETAVRV